MVARAALAAADSWDCFRITNSGYEYVKWLNRENEVQIQREGERNENMHRPAITPNFHQFWNKFLPKMCHSCKVLRGILVDFFFFLNLDISLCGFC